MKLAARLCLQPDMRAFSSHDRVPEGFESLDEIEIWPADIPRQPRAHGVGISSRRLVFEWLPPYSPDVNPKEHVWGHTAYSRLANFIPDDLLHLGRTVSQALSKTRREQRLLRSSFRQAELDL